MHARLWGNFRGSCLNLSSFFRLYRRRWSGIVGDPQEFQPQGLQGKAERNPQAVALRTKADGFSGGAVR
ncbi:hypothetical protein HMPREF0322_03643 [Desulfitobacterium hafniense DP7]|uniref:Uncharacterized protein n=1 Tax=Desulfitobacterium hafniense DP7 TaxID=537010 RepID=G9XRP5_DESHA|nr:hypothetical protein HMPREF0322_03643 [Desulfitobacterium hafniense DP7]